MAIMTAPPSTTAEIVDVPFAHRELVKRLSPGGRYIDAETDVDSPWVPFGDKAAIKHLAFDVRSNTFSNILWVKEPGVVGTHLHRGTIVNVKRIQEMHRGFGGGVFVVLRDGTKLTMSRRYRTRIREVTGMEV